jgi:hypothetical protein
VGVAPVRGGEVAVEQAGGREQERARADAGDGRAPPVRGAQAAQHRGRRRLVGHLPARNDDGVGAAAHCQAVRHLRRHAAGCAQQALAFREEGFELATAGAAAA